MWRSFFLAIGIFAMAFGLQCLGVEKMVLKAKGPLPAKASIWDNVPKMAPNKEFAAQLGPLEPVVQRRGDLPVLLHHPQADERLVGRVGQARATGFPPRNYVAATPAHRTAAHARDLVGLRSRETPWWIASILRELVSPYQLPATNYHLLPHHVTDHLAEVWWAALAGNTVVDSKRLGASLSHPTNYQLLATTYFPTTSRII